MGDSVSLLNPLLVPHNKSIASLHYHVKRQKSAGMWKGKIKEGEGEGLKTLM